MSDIGEDYHAKLLPFPIILRSDRNGKSTSLEELVLGLDLTGFFIEKWLDYSIENKKTMMIRKRFVHSLLT